MDRRVQKAIVLMEMAPYRPLSLCDMASTVNLSVSRLRLLFKTATGTSPAQYFKMLKLRAAKSLLETTFLNVKQISARIGISDASHFVRDFKKVYGMSPAQYRKWHHSEPRLASRVTDARSG